MYILVYNYYLSRMSQRGFMEYPHKKFYYLSKYFESFIKMNTKIKNINDKEEEAGSLCINLALIRSRRF